MIADAVDVALRALEKTQTEVHDSFEAKKAAIREQCSHKYADGKSALYPYCPPAGEDRCNVCGNIV